jgi:imidazolonepropionase-like amidohydrolase
VLGIMHPAISPNGKDIAFAALGDLWVMPLGGAPKRVTHDAFIEIDPAWSPDSRHLVYSTDRAAPAGSMDLWLRDVETGKETRLTAIPGAATKAAWSFDGRRIAFLHDADELDIINVGDTASGMPHVNSRRVEHEPGTPAWSPDGKWIVMSSLHPNSSRFREGTDQVLRLAVDGGPDTWFDPLPHKNVGTRVDFGPVWSPDGTQMAAAVDGHLATFTVDKDGTPTGAVRQLSNDLAESPTWTGDSRHILYQTDDRLKLVDVMDGSVREINPGLTWTERSAVSRTHAVSVIHAGQLWDGVSSTLQKDMDVVLDGTRIKSVQPHTAALHVGKVIDASNETVIPGLIEIHSHLAKPYGESLGRIWLSWGITTVRSPAGNPFEGAEEREAVESGARIGPRTFMAGDPIDGTRIYYPGGTAIDGGVELSQQLARTSRLGYDLMKTYVRLPDLLQKRVIEEAHKRGLPVTSHELYPAVAYGADGVEHIRGTSRRGYSMKQSQLNRTYDDLVQLIAKSGMTLTPTVGIQGGFQLQTIKDPSWLDDPRIKLYPPAALAGSRALATQQHGQTDLDRRSALVKATEKTVFDLVNAGGRITAGTDAAINPYGISLLMEIEQYVDGGVTPLQALRTATTNSAAALGLAADLGAIAPGRLADLVVLDGNPLANIRDLRKVKAVVKDGEAFTEAELLKKPHR